MKKRIFAIAVALVCALGLCGLARAQQTTPSAKLLPVAARLAAASSSTGAATAAAPHRDALETAQLVVTPLIAQDLLSKIPRQVLNASGQTGDVVNLLILGDRKDVRNAIGAAGWSRIACTRLGAVFHDFWGALDLRAYRGLPMSKLYMFGRQQDISYANSKMPFSWWGRHHFRVWQAPFEVDGETLWVAAATHDTGLRWNRAQHHFDHKIDPNVDAERQYVSKTLTKNGRVEVVGYVSPDNAPVQGQTATGESFYTDGRAVVLRVVPKNSAHSAPATMLP